MLAYREIHRQRPQAMVGVAHNMIAWRPGRPTSRMDLRLTNLYRWWYNHRFFQMTARTHDFMGVNYYFSSTKKWQGWPPRVLDEPWGGPRSDMGWPIDPAGLAEVLLELKRYRKPIYITENGLADAADRQRADFLRSHLRAVEHAQGQGADVQGYLHWSLLDNFEWDHGFAPRFGLVEVDYSSMKRTPRPSAYVYKAIIEQANLHL